jgi:hypothetical protein
MNGLSDSLTIGLVLALVFGALFFYIYSRIGQVEKRVSLTENILLDLKMATESTLMAMHTVTDHNETSESQSQQGEPVVGVQATQNQEVEQIPDEVFYKSVLQNTVSQIPLAPTTETTAQGLDDKLSVSDRSTRVEANYESLTLKELKALAKQRGLNTGSMTHKKDFIDALKRQGQSSVLEPVPGSQGDLSGGLEEGFPVELGASSSA